MDACLRRHDIYKCPRAGVWGFKRPPRVNLGANHPPRRLGGCHPSLEFSALETPAETRRFIKRIIFLATNRHELSRINGHKKAQETQKVPLGARAQLVLRSEALLRRVARLQRYLATNGHELTRINGYKKNSFFRNIVVYLC